jgi:hypothetical protein
MAATKWLNPSISVSQIGDSADVQTATRVNGKHNKRRLNGITRRASAQCKSAIRPLNEVGSCP